MALMGLLACACAFAAETPVPKLTAIDNFKTGIRLLEKAQAQSGGIRGDTQRKGAAYISRSAVAGLPEAAEALSEMYEAGIGLPIDLIESATWAYIAENEGKPSQASHVAEAFRSEILDEAKKNAATFQPNVWEPVKMPDEPKAKEPEPEKKPELLLTEDEAIALFEALTVTGISTNERGLCVTVNTTILNQNQSMRIERGAKSYVIECNSLEKDRVILRIRDTPYTHIYEL